MWTTTLTEMREAGWVITALPPSSLEGLTDKQKAELSRAMTLAAYNLIDKLKETRA